MMTICTKFRYSNSHTSASPLTLSLMLLLRFGAASAIPLPPHSHAIVHCLSRLCLRSFLTVTTALRPSPAAPRSGDLSLHQHSVHRTDDVSRELHSVQKGYNCLLVRDRDRCPSEHSLAVCVMRLCLCLCVCGL